MRAAGREGALRRESVVYGFVFLRRYVHVHVTYALPLTSVILENARSELSVQCSCD